MRVAAAAVLTVMTFLLFVRAGAARWGGAKRPWSLAVATGIGAGGSVALWLRVAHDLNGWQTASSALVGAGWILLTRFGLLSHEAVAGRIGRRKSAS